MALRRRRLIRHTNKFPSGLSQTLIPENVLEAPDQVERVRTIAIQLGEDPEGPTTATVSLTDAIPAGFAHVAVLARQGRDRSAAKIEARPNETGVIGHDLAAARGHFGESITPMWRAVDMETPTTQAAVEKAFSSLSQLGSQLRQVYAQEDLALLLQAENFAIHAIA